MPYKDPVKQKESQHQHYLDNKNKYQASHKKAIKTFQRRRRQWLMELKEAVGCKCGEKRGPCLVFHHRDSEEKEHCIGSLYARGMSKQIILKELEKCDVMCANCHQLFHWEEHYGEYNANT